MPATAAMMVPFAFVFKREDGIWKRVVEPVFDMEKSVEVAPAAVDELMTKSVLLKLLFVVVETNSERSP